MGKPVREQKSVDGNDEKDHTFTIDAAHWKNMGPCLILCGYNHRFDRFLLRGQVESVARSPADRIFCVGSKPVLSGLRIYRPMVVCKLAVEKKVLEFFCVLHRIYDYLDHTGRFFCAVFLSPDQQEHFFNPGYLFPICPLRVGRRYRNQNDRTGLRRSERIRETQVIIL
jgi:hypothetical protein